MAIYFTQNTNGIEDIEQMNKIVDKVNQANTTATSNIGQLTDLNNKAQELSNNIQQALPINTELKENIKIGQPLVQEATTKNTELQASLEKTKEFINGLDGSQNIPGIRMELTELQNGLKSNQALEYSGSSISANDTLEGRTEGMKIGGRTLQNLIKDGKGTFVIDKSKSAKRIYEFTPVYNLEKGKKYKGYIFVNNVENTAYGISIYGLGIGNAGAYGKIGKNTGIVKFTWNTSQSDVDSFNKVGIYIENTDFNNGGKATFSNFMLFEEETDLTYIDEYFEGLKSFGEAEQEGDKYKISILSNGKNFINLNERKLQSAQITITDQKANEVTLESNSNNGYIYINLFDIKVSKNTNYVVGCKFENIIDGKYRALKIFGNSTNILLKEITNNDYSVINTGDNEKLQVYLYTNRGSNITGNDTHQKIRFYDIMIAEGSDVNSYTPYQEDKKDILIKEPLREWDSMYEDNGQVKVDRYTSVIDFSNLIINVSEVSERPDAQSTNWFQTNFIPQLKNAKKNTLNFNNKYVGVDAETAWKDKNDFECLSVAVQEGGVRIQGRVKKGATIEQLNEKLRGLIIYYQLATPTVEVVENCVDIDLDTFGEKTYFSIENSIKGTLDFKVPSNIASIVQNTAREVNNIWDVINNLLVPSLIDINKNVAMSTIKNNLK
ncbi:BppU family phage baseplate upper protein [Clostridium perfringens]